MMQQYCALACDAPNLCFVFECEEKAAYRLTALSVQNYTLKQLWSNSELDHECSGSVSQSVEWTIRHVWSMWGASFIAGWLGWKGLCASFRATVVFSCGLLVKWDWLLGSSGQKPAGDHYYCWKNIAQSMGICCTCNHMHAVHAQHH